VEALHEKLAGERHLVDDGGIRQGALAPQMLFVAIQNVGRGGVIANRLPTGNDILISEMSQKLPKPFSIASRDLASALFVLDEQLDKALMDLRDRDATSSKPL
jgi:hypothetical protein